MTNKTTIFFYEGALFLGGVTNTFKVRAPVQVSFDDGEEEGQGRINISPLITSAVFETPSKQTWDFDKSSISVLSSDNITKGIRELYDNYITTLTSVEKSPESNIIGA